MDGKKKQKEGGGGKIEVAWWWWWWSWRGEVGGSRMTKAKRLRWRSERRESERDSGKAVT